MLRIQVLFPLLACYSTALPDEVILDEDGLALNGNLVLASEKTLADGLILMLHGTLGHKDMEIMSNLQSVCTENSRSSLAINLSLDVDNRHGCYPCERPHSHKIDDASEELDAWLTWLESMHAGEIALLGHSRGANQIARKLTAGTLLKRSITCELFWE